MEDQIVTLGMSQSDFGKALIEESQRREKAKLVDSATNEVTRMLSNIEKLKSSVKRDTESIAIYNARLEAISKGEFSLRDNVLVYNEDTLNIQR